MAVLALFLATLFPSSSVTASEPPTATAVRRGSVAPSWQVDLQPVIGNRPLGVVITTPPYEDEAYPKTSLVFLDNNTVAATFVTHENSKEDVLSRRNSETSPTLRLRVILLDAASGKIKATAAWPTTSRFASIVASHGGNFVAQTGRDLTLYSTRLKELKKLQLPPIGKELEWWLPSSSPTGANIVFVATDWRARSTVPWIWVYTDTLQIVRSWKEIQSGYIGISDDRIAMSTCVWPDNDNCDKSLQVRSLSTGWKEVAPISLDHDPTPLFMNDQTIFLYDDSLFELIHSNGAAMIENPQLSQHCGESRPAPSSGGQRFVVPSCNANHASLAFDATGTEVLKKIIVYDRPFSAATYILNLKGPKLKDERKIALSPDGSKLAVLNKESIELFQLPPIR